MKGSMHYLSFEMRHQSIIFFMCVEIDILQNSGPRDKYYLWICKRGGSERVEDSLEAADAGQDGQEGGEREDGQPQGVSQRHGGHCGGGRPQQHHTAHCYMRRSNKYKISPVHVDQH